jgi:glutamate synthase (NADPH) large chain
MTEPRDTIDGPAFVRDWVDNARKLAKSGLYAAEDEHDSCGVGFIAAIDGKPRRSVVEAGIQALKSVWHRGAVDADGKTGDGAGIHVQIPQDFVRDHIERQGVKVGASKVAVGQVFLPRVDLEGQERCRTIVETEIIRMGYGVFGWRQVPVNTSVCGEKANATRPEIEQVMVQNVPGSDDASFERDLYVIRRRIEKQVLAENIADFYVCSLSCRSVVYKGMFLAEQLDEFYPDLKDPRFVSAFAIYHQRYSTNTFPTWSRAQPLRILAHNGEINTLRGNVNWMKSHETRMDRDVFEGAIEDIKPVIQPGSDSAQMDNVFEVLVRGGRPMPMVKTMMIPPAWTFDQKMPAELRAMYSYCNSVMEPWDGPAALAMTDGRWVLAGMDRHGLRPCRFAITGDGLVVVGSETGMVRIDDTNLVEKGRVGPGQMIAIDLEEGRLYRNDELQMWLARSRPFPDWTRNITVIDELVRKHGKQPRAEFDREALRRRMVAVGWTMEDVELLLHPMVEDGKEAVGSMGDDTPLAVLSDRYRGLHHFFRQNFSQVTNPPIDSLRERRAMTLRTRLGNLGNILDEDESQCRLLQLESPVLLNEEFDAMRAYMGDSAVEIDCTFDPGPGGDGGLRLKEALKRIQREAEDAVRGGAVHVILSDKNLGPRAGGAIHAPIPMILAAGGVHTHLVRQQLRTFTSLNVRSPSASTCTTSRC